MEYLHTDPSSGLSYYSSEEPGTGKTIVRSQQDVQPVLDHAARQRAAGERDKGLSGHMKHYCYLPNSVTLQLMSRGINMMNPRPEDWKKFFRIIETEYPKLKTNEMKGWKPS